MSKEMADEEKVLGEIDATIDRLTETDKRLTALVEGLQPKMETLRVFLDQMDRFGKLAAEFKLLMDEGVIDVLAEAAQKLVTPPLPPAPEPPRRSGKVD